MKLLVQVNTIDGERETAIAYAIVEVNAETIEYLTQRKALFAVTKKYADDLSDMRFWGCSFITFCGDIDIYNMMSEDERHKFDEQGYWQVSDDFSNENDEEIVEWEFEQVVIDGDGWYVTANEKDVGVEIKTREIPHDISKQ